MARKRAGVDAGDLPAAGVGQPPEDACLLLRRATVPAGADSGGSRSVRAMVTSS